MKLTKPQTGLFIALGVLAAALMGAAALWDLPLDRAVYDPTSWPAILFEAFCYWPLYLPVALLGASWTFLYRQNPARHVLGEMLVILVFYILWQQALAALSKRGLLPLSALALSGLSLALTFLCTLALVSAAGRWGKAWLLKAEFIAKFGLAFCVAENLIINPLKLLWSRMRFDDMAAAGDFSAFSPWYRFGPVRGNTSFPSGHTGAACGILLLLLLPPLFGRMKKRAFPLTCFCAAYIGCTGFSRMVMGRHYLSDTVAASLIATGLFLLMTHSRRFAAALGRTRARAAQAGRQAENGAGPVPDAVDTANGPGPGAAGGPDSPGGPQDAAGPAGAETE